MSEFKRFQTALRQDAAVQAQYLQLLDRMTAGGDVTAETAAEAAAQLGFAVSAEELRQAAERGEAVSESELRDLEGRESASDGRTVGCPYQFYLTWTDYWISNQAGLCPQGGRHELGPGSGERICKKCGLSLDERGTTDIYDRFGRQK